MSRTQRSSPDSRQTRRSRDPAPQRRLLVPGPGHRRSTGRIVEIVPRIRLVDPDDPDADPKARALLLTLRDRFGADVNVLRALANHPDLMESFLHLGAQPAPPPHIRPDQRELAYLTASVANDCHY